jgi:magnesium transporter
MFQANPSKKAMLKFVKKISHQSGLAPGTLLHIGEKKAEQFLLRVLRYDETRFEERTVPDIDDCVPTPGSPGVTWVRAIGLHDVARLEKLGERFGFHPLVMEDVVNTHQQPKIDVHEGYISFIFKFLCWDAKDHEIEVEQVSLILGPNYVISFEEKEGDFFKGVRDRIANAHGRIRKTGSDYLAYGLLDAVVDQYFVVLEKFGDKIETLEEHLIRHPTPKTLHALHHLKKEMLFIRKAIWPLREAVNVLERDETELVHDTTRVYLRDVYDHTLQVLDMVETMRDILSGMVDIYLSSMSNRMNEIMKILTIITTVFIPPTFLAGIYGMNFENMPELQSRWGYYVVWGVAVALMISMLTYFRKKRWI